MDSNFARKVILDSVKLELAKRYPSSTLRFSTFANRTPNAVTIAAKERLVKSTKYIQCTISTVGMNSISQLIDALETKVDWFK